MAEELQTEFDIAEYDIRQRWRTRPPKEFPAKWACEWGFDEYGLWQTFKVKDISHKMRYIPPGSFLMGAPDDEEDGNDVEKPQHKVGITKGFWLGETTVTQALWAEIMEDNQSPSHFQPESDEQLPVEKVSWLDCQQFCQKLSELTGSKFSLPTEAQWEYACRAGTKTAFSFGDWVTPKDANYFDGPDRTVDVFQFETNYWGLKQMHGNVLEWCLDDLREYDNQDVSDPVGDVTERAALAVLRGGCWGNLGHYCRSAARSLGGRDGRISSFGLRVTQVIEPEA